MADYDLLGLSTRSFEKLVQAIAGAVLGQGTVTFGDGPDGGREAVFEGRMDYPSQVDPWDGYCVVQAKFLQRPKGSGPDGRWVLKQLEQELKGFADRKKRRKVPEYYVFATNVVLTPAASRGTKDKAAAMFKRFHKDVPLRGWRIWDFDEIGRFLDTFGEIRRSYSAWITSGDVLHEVVFQLALKKPDFLEVLSNFLAKELRTDQFANLEQAGHASEERIPLAQVFIDLPTTMQRTAEPPDEEGSSELRVTELVRDLIERAKDTLDPASTSRGRDPSDVRRTTREGPQLGRYVLVGGPGQGKTTVGQFTCQLFRAAILRNRPTHTLPPEVHDTLKAIEEQCTHGALELPMARRFPIRIVLSDFATTLSKDSDLSLISHLAQHIKRRTGKTVESDDLRAWLRAYPWLVILDGLDEVPSSTNRDEVLRKVEDFWVDAAQLNADLLVLATTRPQGYSDDFSPAYYCHLWLAPLSPKRALAYARRLAQVRYGGEPDRRQKIIERLSVASHEESTARLMRSPLQVTIMATLVDQIGTPPQDRWRLFHDYYEVIYNRERERSIPAAELLREHKENIDAIHHRVGLVLQVESERAGGTEAKLATERFCALVAARLEEEGYSGEDLRVLCDRMIEAAANRLVFLVGLEAGQIGFEIRSLQEYMAAESLMTGSQNKVQERLRRIAPIASWRNVFLFAVGRCFVRDQHLRDTVHTICTELNDELAGPQGRAILAGSVLAVDLLEDGVARRQPKYARLLTQCAVRLLELPPDENHARLADISDGDVESIVRDHLQQRLSFPFPLNLSAWSTLVSLVKRNIPWATELADRMWPTPPNERLAILSLPNVNLSSPWIEKRAETVMGENPPSEARALIHGVAFRPRREQARSLFGLPFAWFAYRDVEQIRVEIVGLGGGFTLTPLLAAQQVAGEVTTQYLRHPAWLPYLEDINFARNPSRQALAEALSRLAGECKGAPSKFGTAGPFLSWPLWACIAHADSASELGALSSRAAVGDLGDLEDWLAAEDRWRRQGVTLDDFLYGAALALPFDREIAMRGLVIGGVWTYGGDDIELAKVYDTLQRVGTNTRMQANFLAWLFFVALSRDNTAPPTWLTPEIVTRLLQISTQRWLDSRVVMLLAKWALHDGRWSEVLDEMGRLVRLLGRGHDYSAQPLVSLLRQYPQKIGILALIARMADPSVNVSELPQLKPEDCDTPTIRSAAIAFEVAKGHLSNQRAKALARQTVDIADQEMQALRDVLGTLSRCERWDAAVDTYLLELLESLEKVAFSERAAVLGALNDSLRRKASGLTDVATWKAMALPATLLC